MRNGVSLSKAKLINPDRSFKTHRRACPENSLFTVLYLQLVSRCYTVKATLKTRTKQKNLPLSFCKKTLIFAGSFRTFSLQIASNILKRFQSFLYRLSTATISSIKEDPNLLHSGYAWELKSTCAPSVLGLRMWSNEQHLEEQDNDSQHHKESIKLFI